MQIQNIGRPAKLYDVQYISGIPVAAGEHIFENSGVDIRGGYAYAATGNPTGLQWSGLVADAEVDNTGGANGAATITLKAFGIFLWTNSTANPLVAANLGQKVRFEDNDTMTLAGNGGVAGIFVGFGGPANTLVWVKMTSEPIIARGQIAADVFGAGLALDANARITTSALATPATRFADPQTVGAGAIALAAGCDFFPLQAAAPANLADANVPAVVPGREITLFGTDNVNTITIPATLAAVKLAGGASATLGEGSNLTLVGINAGGSTWWQEKGRAL
jgi:hypothetical protein